MKLFIWEGDGISAGYHDDGSLIVLAHDVDSARTLAIMSAPVPEDTGDGWDLLRERPWEVIDNPSTVWRDGHRPPYMSRHEPPTMKSIMRPPDRIVDLDKPCVVSFNGGGYD